MESGRLSYMLIVAMATITKNRKLLENILHDKTTKQSE